MLHRHLSIAFDWEIRRLRDCQIRSASAVDKVNKLIGRGPRNAAAAPALIVRVDGRLNVVEKRTRGFCISNIFKRPRLRTQDARVQEPGLSHRNKIGFFHHVPFPPPEFLTALPNHEHLIPTISHYDLVGFQTEIDAANFARYLRKECGMLNRDPFTFQAADRTVRIGIFPVGVETAQLSRLARRSVHSPFVRDVVESLAGLVMIIGVDGIVTFAKYRRFLSQFGLAMRALRH